MPHPFRPAALSVVTVIGILGWDGAAQAQIDIGKLPFANPQQMFERFFGEDSEADREALRKIDISIDDERRLGAQILEAGLAALKRERIAVDAKGRDVEYIQSLVETVSPFMTNRDRYPKIRVLVARSSRCDARSCPGGTLIFFEGLLAAAKSEAALIGVVGHELSHLDRGHQLLPLKRMKLMEQTFQKGFDPDAFFRDGPWMTKLMSRPFRPEDERDADRDGVAWSFAAGYDPREMARLFQRQGAKGKADDEQIVWPSFFRTHPYDHERHQAILKQFAQLRRQEPKKKLFIGETNLAERRSRKQMEAD
jgi:predicted Zn-dependent protease